MVLVLAGVLLGIKPRRRRGTSTVPSSAATPRPARCLVWRCKELVTARCTLTRRLSEARRSLPVRLPVPSLLQRDRPAGLQRHTWSPHWRKVGGRPGAAPDRRAAWRPSLLRSGDSELGAVGA